MRGFAAAFVGLVALRMPVGAFFLVAEVGALFESRFLNRFARLGLGGRDSLYANRFCNWSFETMCWRRFFEAGGCSTRFADCLDSLSKPIEGDCWEISLGRGVTFRYWWRSCFGRARRRTSICD
ncbi:hypothetical protein GE09DRAFT_88962 [Coniochaeta sp. 2T2.1]|nr:hypothetical protein GE09DRAFT_88962 [Coniochaeta sp. 2T2.1]